MFVKICGVTTPEAVAAAVDAGADAIGFVFAASPRQVSPAKAYALCEGLDRSILRIAVMRHPDRALADTVFEQFAPDCVQTDAEDFATLPLPPDCTALPVYRSRPAVAISGELPPQLLFEGPNSGTGQLADWHEAGRLAHATRVILAGGLDPDNVGTAIQRIHPWGVDVSSGVERAPGDKDPERIRQFILRARSADTEKTHAG